MKKKGIWILLFCVVWVQCFGFSINYCECYGAHLGNYSCCSEEHSHTNIQPDNKEKTSQFTTHYCLDIEIEGFQFLCNAKSKIVLPYNLFSIIPYQFITLHKHQTSTNTSSCCGIPPLLQSCILRT